MHDCILASSFMQCNRVATVTDQDRVFMTLMALINPASVTGHSIG